MPGLPEYPLGFWLPVPSWNSGKRVCRIVPPPQRPWIGNSMSAFVKKLRAEAAARAASYVSLEQELQQRVAVAIGDRTTISIPELQRALYADPRAIGRALRALGYRRKRIWSGPDYAFTRWQRSS